jgi:predicted nucleic acid-binding protein
LILDSSTLIAAERHGSNARQALIEIARLAPGEDVGLSVVSVSELMHGVIRADSSARRAMRRQFLDELLTALPVFPVTVPIALRTGELDAHCAAAGIRLALADLLIGVTALELGYSVATRNVRHFEKIPGLNVVHI